MLVGIDKKMEYLKQPDTIKIPFKHYYQFLILLILSLKPDRNPLDLTR